MPAIYRRPGVYLEESLLISPSDVAGTFTVAAFVGVAGKGPANIPIRVESWSDFVTIFGGFELITPPTPVDPNDVTARLGGQRYANLAALQADPNQGDGKYNGIAFTAGQYVVIDDNSKNSYYTQPAQSTDKAAVAPGSIYAAEATVTASDAPNAAKLLGTNEVQTLTMTGTATGGTFTLTVLGTTTGAIAYNAASTAIKTALDTAIPGNNITVGGGPLPTAVTLTFVGYGDVPLVTVTSSLTGTSPVLTPTVTTPGTDLLGYKAVPKTAWTAGQYVYIGQWAFHWSGTAWAADPGAPSLEVSHWKAGAYPGTGASIPTNTQVLSYLPFTVYTFFQNGGRFAWVVRSVTGNTNRAGTASSKSVTGKPTANGAAATAFTLSALSVGLWGNGLSYRLTTQAANNAFTLQILMRNAAGQDEVMETFRDLTLDGLTSGTYRADARINNLTSGSRFVRMATVDPLNYIFTTDQNAVPLTGGVDPDLPDISDLQDSAKKLGQVEGPMVVNIASYLRDATKADSANMSDSWIGTSISPQTAFPDREDVICINDAAMPRDVGRDSAFYSGALATQGVTSVDSSSSYVASYVPWIIIPHPTAVGSVVTIPPGGAVAGIMARIDATVGPQRAPAGIIAGVANAVGVQTKFTDTELGDLNSRNLNVIRPVVGSGICVMGARTRKGYGPDRYVSARRVLINLKESLRRSTNFAIFENNDERLWSSLRITADNILRPMWERGGLRGQAASEAYYILCDSSINTPSVIASGEVRMQIGVALEYPAEFVVIRITQITTSTFPNEVQPLG